MTALTPDEARDYACPVARVKGYDKPPAKCEADACVLWRWMPLDAGLLTPHVKARRKEVGPSVAHHEIVAWVMSRREALGIPTQPTHGYCGLGGKPE